MVKWPSAAEMDVSFLLLRRWVSPSQPPQVRNRRSGVVLAELNFPTSPSQPINVSQWPISVIFLVSGAQRARSFVETASDVISWLEIQLHLTKYSVGVDLQSGKYDVFHGVSHYLQGPGTGVYKVE